MFYSEIDKIFTIDQTVPLKTVSLLIAVKKHYCNAYGS